MENNFYCSFSYGASTYGHECGAPATKTAIMPKGKPVVGMGGQFKGEFYFAHRCERCAKIKGGENSEVIRFEVLDKEKHVNVWERFS